MADLVHNSVVEVGVDLDIVVAESEVVEVEVLIDVLILAAGEFQDLGTDGLIIGGPEPVPLVILEVADSDLEEGADVEGAQRKHPGVALPVLVVLLLDVGVGARPASLDVLVLVVDDDVGVHHLQLLQSVD